MVNHGFVRVAAATPSIKVADCDYNTNEIVTLIEESERKGISIALFPELSISGYTCADLFHQQLLLDGVEESIRKIRRVLKNKKVIAIVGLPIAINNKLYNCAAVISGGEIHGIVPKTYIPNYSEYQEKRWFSSVKELSVKNIFYADQTVEIGASLLFETPFVKFGIEICEDLWTPIPPSSLLALNGADIIFNLSASNETAGKHNYRRSLVAQQSARCLSAYVYASAGCGESTTDLVFAGCSMIAENGSVLADADRFSFDSSIISADIDIDYLRSNRMTNTSFTDDKFNYSSDAMYRIIKIQSARQKIELLNRYISQTPFVPTHTETLDERCNEIFSIQVTGLAKRLIHTNSKTAVIGVSGGLDSTLALLVLVKAFDKLGLSHNGIYGITMPGFGTTNRTCSNAIGLMQALGVTIKEIPIKEAVIQHFKDIEHDINKHDTTYENSQARERTQILMDYANKVNGLVIGTGDMSELALGWCTYNGDHMSMYAVNSGIPKTLVRTLVKWISDNQMDTSSKNILNDVIDTPVSPELLPADANGNISQITEEVVGPYILHDFFLYYTLRLGFTPKKVYYLAQHAFSGAYTKEEIHKWLHIFYSRFISQQFKRSCLPDGPKVGSVNLSPRGDWRMPSDASSALWMKELEDLK